MMTDPIADMLTRIRNAVRVERPHVRHAALEGQARPGRGAQARRLHLGLGEEEVEGPPAKQLRLHLKYGPNGERVIRHIRRVSKPGRRVYSGADRPEAGAQRTGNFDHQHQPRRDQRPRSPAAKARRRSPLRSLVDHPRPSIPDRVDSPTAHSPKSPCPELEKNRSPFPAA